MDRRSFIKQNQLDQAESTLCGEVYCVCEEIPIQKKTQEMKSTDTFHLIIIGCFAFLSAFVFAEYKSHTLTDVTAMLLEKKVLVISCRKKWNDRTPGNQNDKNSCSHQQLTLTLSERKKIRYGSWV